MDRFIQFAGPNGNHQDIHTSRAFHDFAVFVEEVISVKISEDDDHSKINWHTPSLEATWIANGWKDWEDASKHINCLLDLVYLWLIYGYGAKYYRDYKNYLIGIIRLIEHARVDDGTGVTDYPLLNGLIEGREDIPVRHIFNWGTHENLDWTDSMHVIRSGDRSYPECSDSGYGDEEFDHPTLVKDPTEGFDHPALREDIFEHYREKYLERVRQQEQLDLLKAIKDSLHEKENH